MSLRHVSEHRSSKPLVSPMIQTECWLGCHDLGGLDPSLTLFVSGASVLFPQETGLPFPFHRKDGIETEQSTKHSNCPQTELRRATIAVIFIHVILSIFLLRYSFSTMILIWIG